MEAPASMISTGTRAPVPVDMILLIVNQVSHSKVSLSLGRTQDTIYMVNYTYAYIKKASQIRKKLQLIICLKRHS